MRCVNFASAVLLGMSALSALAQAPSSLDPVIGPRPSHDVGTGDSQSASAISSNATMHDYLQTTRTLLVAGHTRQAQQSLEIAEARAFDRLVAPDQTDVVSSSHMFSDIQEIRSALGNGDGTHAVQLIDLALSN